MWKRTALMLPTTFCLRSSAVFAFMPSIPSFIAVPRASRIQRGFAHLANDLSAAGAIAGVHAEATAAPSPLQRIQGTGGLRQLPKVEPVNELVSRARNRAFRVKADKRIKNARQRARKHAAMRLDCMTKELSVPMRELVEGYRKQLRRLHPYESVVADLTTRALERDGTATLSRVLSSCKELHKEVLEVGKAQASQAKDAPTAADAEALAEAGCASIAAVLERPSSVKLLLQMMDIQKALRKVPVIELDMPSVVLVGAPNVGKSSIIRAISTGTPEVNDYPFTTRGVTLGHLFAQPQGDGSSEDPGARYQLMDTPGVLARDDVLRNEMESLTIASLQHLPTAVMFVADLSGLSGDDKSSVADQCAVRRELRQRFPKRPWLDVISKTDLPTEDGAVELFLDAVREMDTTIASSDDASDSDGGAASVFRARGSVAEVLSVSVLSGSGVPEVEAAVRSMLAQVNVVLRKYERVQRAAAEAESAARADPAEADPP